MQLKMQMKMQQKTSRYLSLAQPNHPTMSQRKEDARRYKMEEHGTENAKQHAKEGKKMQHILAPGPTLPPSHGPLNS
jgi:hypothetical protein